MHPNLKAYKGFEDLSQFDDATFEEYIKNKLTGCNKRVEFIKKNLIDDQYGGRVLEIGSGNGKLLYNLEKQGLLEQGIGYDVSESRNRFANKFGEYLGSKKVTNILGNFLTIDQQIDKFDLVIAVDIVIQLISPLSKTAQSDLFNTIKAILKNNGWLLLELQDFESTIKMIQLSDGVLRQWKEFHDSDPWRFGLDTFTVQDRDIEWNKKFINRDARVEMSSSNAILRAYTRDEISELLKDVGFGEIKFFDFWSEPGDLVNHEEYIVVARLSG